MAVQRVGAGTESAADAARRHVLAFDGWQQGGELILSCRYAARHHRETVQGLLERVRHMAQQLADACQTSAAAVYTPSDFKGMSFSQDEMDGHLGQIEETDPKNRSEEHTSKLQSIMRYTTAVL